MKELILRLGPKGQRTRPSPWFRFPPAAVVGSMNSEGSQPGRTGMFFIGGAAGTALATVIGFMTMMALDESVALTAPTTVTTVGAQGTQVTLVDSADTSITFSGTEFAYSPSEGTVSGGFELIFENAGRVLHNLEIEGVSGLLLEANPGKSSAETIRLEPGSYTIFCSIPGHRQAGMEGTLTVES